MLIDLLESSKAIGLCPMGIFDKIIHFSMQFSAVLSISIVKT